MSSKSCQDDEEELSISVAGLKHMSQCEFWTMHYDQVLIHDLFFSSSKVHHGFCTGNLRTWIKNVRLKNSSKLYMKVVSQEVKGSTLRLNAARGQPFE